ncbi:MAG: ABC transporter substrate-binding protein [bacterium]|nr:ABC transporter substrate-binding protein [bacterium]
MLRLLRAFVRFERILLAGLLFIFLITTVFFLRRFYLENTMVVAAEGGTYIEGSVGELQPLIPWFTVTNDVNRDIVSLVFSGLQKYNPETKSVEDDLAVLEVTDDNMFYTVTLKENIFWHDTTESDPHPVTADDVVYTFTTIQEVDFPNSLLRQNFLGVTIEKLSDRKVRFALEKPYRFFASNLTLGLIPERSFISIPPSKLDQALGFGFHPIGCGPYAFRGLVQTELSTEISLARFDRTIEPYYHLESVIFRIFPDYSTLLADIRNVDGIRLVPTNEQGYPIIPKSLKSLHYTLPQYVALFLNLSQPILQDRNLRLGLQLGTDKQNIVSTIGESIIVDTPLLELNTNDWQYKYDSQAAQGAFFASDWHLPEKVRLQRLLELYDANSVGLLQLEPITLLDTGASLIITGSLLDISLDATVHGIQIEQSTETGTWIVALPTHGGTGSINLGFNAIRLEDKGDTIDSFYLWRTTKSQEFKRASQEQDLLDQFIASRNGDLVEADQIGVQNLFLENGMLRLRLSTDPTDIRINDNGEKLSLRLLTSNSPAHYQVIAENIKAQWEELGVHVGIEIPETRAKFEQKLINRDYDILLFGQSLLDNLDSYPYWHSSGVQDLEGERSELRIDSYNLSQYSSLEADSLLEVIRETGSTEKQDLALLELREVLKEEIPAIFLYSPLYTYAYNPNLHGAVIGNPSLHSDRFLTLHRWYMKKDRSFKTGKNWLSAVPWLFSSVK